MQWEQSGPNKVLNASGLAITVPLVGSAAKAEPRPKTKVTRKENTVCRIANPSQFEEESSALENRKSETHVCRITAGCLCGFVRQPSPFFFSLVRSSRMYPGGGRVENRSSNCPNPFGS